MYLSGLSLHFMNDPCLSSYYKFFFIRWLLLFQYPRGRAYVIGHFKYHIFTFRVGQQLSAGVPFFKFGYFLSRKYLMHHAGAVP